MDSIPPRARARRRTLLLLLSSASAAALVATWGPGSGAGRTSEAAGEGPPCRPPPPCRIVSLLPSATEVVVALGAASRVVGRTVHDRHPSVGGAAVVGDPARPAEELVVSLRPDLVVTWSGVTDPRFEAKLAAAGTTVYGGRMESVADLGRTAVELAALLGVPEEGARLSRRIARELDALGRAAPPPGGRPAVLVLLDAPTLLTAGPGSFAHELIGIAGGRNVFADARVAWPRVSAEAVLARDPDFVVVAERAGAPGRMPEPAWSALGAVRGGRVLRLPADRLARPGPGLVGVAREIARFLRAGGPP